MYKALSTNVVYWMLMLLCLSHSKLLLSEALPIGTLPKSGRWESSGSDDESEIEQDYVSPEHKVYKKLMIGMRLNRSIHKRTSAYVRRGRLFNRNGYVLSVNSDGTVDGTTNRNSPFAQLEFHSVGAGILMILGVTSQRYLSINDNGRLCGSEDPSSNTIFQEVHETNMFHSYVSYKHRKWLVGIKRNGKAKKATLTRPGQKSVQFLITYT